MSKRKTKKWWKGVDSNNDSPSENKNNGFGNGAVYDEFYEKDSKSWKDWFLNRDQDTFVKKNENAFDWKSRMGGRSYSSYFFDDRHGASWKNSKELIKKSFEMARNFGLSINSKDRLVFIESEEANLPKNARTLRLDTKIFDDDSLKDEEKTDIFLGNTIHEISHTTYSDLQKLEEVAIERNPIYNALTHLIEDERIEQQLADEFPGYANYVGQSKKHFWEKEFPKTTNYKNLDPVSKMFFTLAHVIRYPKNLTEQQVQEHSEMLTKVKNVLKKSPKSTKESADLAKKIFDIFKQEKNEYMDQMMQDFADDACEKNEKEINKNNSNDNLDFQKQLSQKFLNDLKDSQRTGKAPKWENENNKKEQEENKKGDDNRSKDEAKKMEQFNEELRKQILKDYKKENGNNSNEGGMEYSVVGTANKLMSQIDTSALGEVSKKPIEDAKDLQNDSSFAIEMEGEFGYRITGEAKDTVFKKMKSDEASKSAYKAVYNEISSYKSTLAKILRLHSVDKKLVFKSMRNGHLDCNKLAEATQGIPNVYEKYGHVKSKKVAVAILIDQSGSMSGQKIRNAAKTAILFNEAFANNKEIEFFAYGHTTGMAFGSSVDMMIYKEPSKEFKEFAYSLGQTGRAYNANKDGQAIWETALRIRKFTDRPCVLFVVSDGAPSAYGSINGVHHTRDMVRKATNDLNMEIIQIAIESSVPSEQMFKNFVKLTNIATLPKDLGIVMKKVVGDLMNKGMENVRY